MADNNELDNVIYSYTASASQLENENRLLKDAVDKLKKELEKYKQTPLMICDVVDLESGQAIIKIPNGNQFLVNIAGECEKLFPGDSILVEQKNLTVIRKLEVSKRFDVERFIIIEKPKVQWVEVGGLDTQIRELQEVVELPLKKPQLFKKLGITPPKGVLLYGPPGTGKTLLAKAVASSTNSTFIEIVASELVQKFIGEGAKLIKEIFTLARRKAPCVIFIDEIDALAAQRIEIGTSGEREVQRTFMQFLAELDGFKPLENVKVIACTNRKDILDPAILRPGRFDRLIRVPPPNDDGKLEILKIHTKDMRLEKGIELRKISLAMTEFTGAEIKAACTEAGYFAIRESRSSITRKDFLDAIVKVKREEEIEGQDYLKMFG